ncbi:MAG: metallophosphoesterase family protein [Rhodobacteraceae bacterium]|nr:metallophosphoesterase family protein [Paracoccaceae bacterium]
MRLAAISDVHGNSAALEAVLDDIARRGVDLTVNLGDCVSGPLDAAGTMDLLHANPMPTVMGNHDRAMVTTPPEKLGMWEAWVYPELTPTDLNWLRDLPKTIEMDDIFLCHATPDRDDENWLDRRGDNQRIAARERAAVEAYAEGIDASLILCGHTHTPRMVRLSGNRCVVNTGSVGVPAYFDDRFDPPFIHETGAPDARYAICERVGGAWHVDHISVPYDSGAMQARALERGAESWAQALATGWFTPQS